jgi:hypothetical protein
MPAGSHGKELKNKMDTIDIWVQDSCPDILALSGNMVKWFCDRKH